MRFGSVCSGIEAASVAWEPLGFKPAWFTEIEEFPCAVLEHRWPKVNNLGDITELPERILSGEIEAPEVVIGGTPCQSFSVAGARQGMADERGQLTISFVEIINAVDERRIKGGEDEAIAVWENVSGVLTSRDNSFGAFLGYLSGECCELQPPRAKWSNAGFVLGPTRAIAWRILDAQYFGVPQHRRRLFVVASARNGFDPRKVLFEYEGVRRDHPPTQQEKGSGRWWNGNHVSQTLDAVLNKGQMMPEKNRFPVVTGCPLCSLATAPFVNSVVNPFVIGAKPTIPSVAVLAHLRQRNMTTASLEANCGHENALRRLTVIECERLQGFPDGHTRVPYKHKPAERCPDGPRLTAIGNSMPVPVVRWLGQRILNEVNHERYREAG